MTESDIMTMDEAWPFLRLPSRQSLAMHVHRRHVPYMKLGREVRFSRRRLIEHMEKRGHSGNIKVNARGK